jgi:NTE family protein
VKRGLGGMSRWALAFAALLVLAGCASRAHYPINPPLEHYDPKYGFRLENVATDPDNAREMLVVLLFSGGGTRAAALAYGALEALRDTDVYVGGKKHNMLTEVDYISAISGGAVVAAYYGLYRDRIFVDFGKKFLYRDVQGELTDALVLNLYTLTSPRFGRSDLFSEYLDRNLFEGMTYRELAQRPRPFIAISATDISLGAQFVFSQAQFDLICSDLSSFKIARAVAASAAIPPILSPVTLWNYAGRCGYTPPPFVTVPIEHDPRREHDRMEMASYLDVDNRPYLHLLDGGLMDNLGLRQPMAVVMRYGGIASTLEALGYADLRYAVFISVDAEREPTLELDRSADVPGPVKSLTAMKNILAASSFDASVHVEEALQQWQADLVAARKPGEPPPEFFVIDMSLRAITDETTRRRFMTIPTSLRLPPDDIDALRALAGTLMRESPDFQRLMAKIGTPDAAGTAPAGAGKR